VLYSHPELMNDIVTGENYGCGGKAFNAIEGWDPVTGLGTPDYERLLELYLSLP
jgi:tripeptidyl-peptidase-1